MTDPKKKYQVTWMNESNATFEVELTKAEKIAITNFFHEAAKHVESFDMPSIHIEEKE